MGSISLQLGHECQLIGMMCWHLSMNVPNPAAGNTDSQCNSVFRLQCPCSQWKQAGRWCGNGCKTLIQKCQWMWYHWGYNRWYPLHLLQFPMPHWQIKEPPSNHGVKGRLCQFIRPSKAGWFDDNLWHRPSIYLGPLHVPHRVYISIYPNTVPIMFPVTQLFPIRSFSFMLFVSLSSVSFFLAV